MSWAGHDDCFIDGRLQRMVANQSAQKLQYDKKTENMMFDLKIFNNLFPPSWSKEGIPVADDFVRDAVQPDHLL